MAQNSKLSQVLAWAKLWWSQSALSRVLWTKPVEQIEIPRVFTDPFSLATRKSESTPVKNAWTLTEQKPFTSSTPISDQEKQESRSSILERIKNINPAKLASGVVSTITNPISSLLTGSVRNIERETGTDLSKLPWAVASQSVRLWQSIGTAAWKNLWTLGRTIWTLTWWPVLWALWDIAWRIVNRDTAWEVWWIVWWTALWLATSPLQIAQTWANLSKATAELLLNKDPEPFINEMVLHPDYSKWFLESLRPWERKLTSDEEWIKKVATWDKDAWKGYTDSQIDKALVAMWIPLIAAKWAEMFMIFDSLKPSPKVKSLVTTELWDSTRNSALIELWLKGNPSKAEIKLKRDQLVRQYHPDLHPELWEAWAAKTKQINSAYNYLLRERKIAAKEAVVEDPFSVLWLDRKKADAWDIEKATYDLLNKNRWNREKLDSIYRARKYAQDELAARQAENLSARRTSLENVERQPSWPTIYAEWNAPKRLTVWEGRNVIPVAPISQAIEFNILDSDRIKKIDSNNKKIEKIGSDISKVTSWQITEKEISKLRELTSKVKALETSNEELRSQLISTSWPVSQRTIEARTSEPVVNQPTQITTEPTQIQPSQITSVPTAVETPTITQPVVQQTTTKPSALSKVLPSTRGIPATSTVEPKIAPTRRVVSKKVSTTTKKESALRKAIYPREDAVLRAKAEELNKAKEKAKIQKEKRIYSG